MGLRAGRIHPDPLPSKIESGEDRSRSCAAALLQLQRCEGGDDTRSACPLWPLLRIELHTAWRTTGTDTLAALSAMVPSSQPLLAQRLPAETAPVRITLPLAPALCPQRPKRCAGLGGRFGVVLFRV